MPIVGVTQGINNPPLAVTALPFSVRDPVTFTPPLAVTRPVAFKVSVTRPFVTAAPPLAVRLPVAEMFVVASVPPTLTLPVAERFVVVTVPPTCTLPAIVAVVPPAPRLSVIVTALWDRRSSWVWGVACRGWVGGVKLPV